MSTADETPEKRVAVVAPAAMDLLIRLLAAEGYLVVGPTVHDGAVMYDRLQALADLPVGWTDRQEAGGYRLARRSDTALFGFAAGQESWKKFLLPSTERFWEVRTENGAYAYEPGEAVHERYAFIGARSCDLHAIAILDKVMTGGKLADPWYCARHADTFVLAVNCCHAGGTCFCVSMGTGPRATFGYDLLVTEVLAEGDHRLVLESGSARGARMIEALPHRPARSEDLAAVDRVVEETALKMGRSLETRDIKELLYRNYEHPRWEEVAGRCLSCANCTIVCPTCFCTTIEDTSDLSGSYAERHRRWDSCFTLDFSYLHGGRVRLSTLARYRQWMTHKLATWIDQFGTSGCVGCGRCITWCPVGIDITEEAREIRRTDGNQRQ